jgi:7,8-dihydropterin-6-yl-methyl-4-(beta-D-ribofuranosyl)aminobenzene 5'-phosphate synthase
LICSTHCTQYKQEIKFLYPESYIEGGVGKVIDIKDAASGSKSYGGYF